ncbi:anti-sigma factor family protein [Mycoplana dimorpha]|uniref:Anti-sigma factor RsiW n=1 Tax=Mycoplana dimorpha TaxID=28320 RepID=A0A2T5B8K0_MYCDI|nr:anti-sigma factor [Mycoplana dimorpha]PTM95284.1 anti-sigma factor RsiW [Mycoplana dimorpha]
MTDARLPPEADLLLLNALVDGELDAPAAAALERRVADEPEMGKAHEAIVATRAALARLERPEVGRRLLDRIEAAAGVSGPTSPVRQPRRQADWRALAASVALAFVVAGSGGYWLGANSPGETASDLVASTHRRSLLAANPVDIASSDRHTVKPWLDNRIGLSPPAPDLAAKGFALVGGRVDVIRGNAVPTLVYRHNEHLITVVAVPAAAGTSGPQSKQANGYNMVSWTGSGFSYWAVSDLERAELDRFVEDYRTATGVAASPES